MTTDTISTWTNKQAPSRPSQNSPSFFTQALLQSPKLSQAPGHKQTAQVVGSSFLWQGEHAGQRLRATARRGWGAKNFPPGLKGARPAELALRPFCLLLSLFQLRLSRRALTFQDYFISHRHISVFVRSAASYIDFKSTRLVLGAPEGLRQPPPLPPPLPFFALPAPAAVPGGPTSWRRGYGSGFECLRCEINVS